MLFLCYQMADKGEKTDSNPSVRILQSTTQTHWREVPSILLHQEQRDSRQGGRHLETVEGGNVIDEWEWPYLN